MAISMIKFLVAACILFSITSTSVDAVIAVNWGRNARANLIPSVVVDLLLQSGVKEVKIFSSEIAVIKAFEGTDIALTVSIGNPSMVANKAAAREWFRKTIEPYPSINFKYVSVGNNAFSMARRSNVSFSSIAERIIMFQEVLDELGYGNKTKVIITHSLNGVLVKNNTTPSQAEFLPDVEEAMVQTLDILNKTGTPFFFEFLPFEHIHTLGLDYEFAFSDDKSKLVIKDINGFHYSNVFDLVYDSFAWALEKHGYGNIKMVVCQIGWPTDGYEGASVESAERFWKALLPRVVSNKGTPMRPGEPIDINVHAVTDENNNPPTFSSFARHWGFYRGNGQPKYKIDLTGQGRDIFPAVARSVNLMPARWCVFNEDMSNAGKVRTQFDYACTYADCTCLSPGGTCGMLTYKQNVSYAFNAYFQSSFQDEEACDFEGLAKIVVENPSIGGCIFTVEVIRGTQQPVKPIMRPK